MDNRKRSRIFISIIIIIILVIPVGVGIGVSLPIFMNIENSNDWIGFWGGYLGAIIGGIVTLYVLWRTVNDNENARKNDERLHFFEKIIELFSKYSASCGNVCALATRLITIPSNELYKNFLLQINELAGISTEIEILLMSRGKIYNCNEFICKLSEVDNEINEFCNKFEYEFSKNQFDKNAADDLDKEMNQILEKVVALSKVLTECVKNNLEMSL